MIDQKVVLELAIKDTNIIVKDKEVDARFGGSNR